MGNATLPTQTTTNTAGHQARRPRAPRHWGETGGAEPVPDEIAAFCRERLASYKVPVRFHVVAEMPVNADGKILKRVLRAP